MFDGNLQALCERGQLELMETRYLDAVQTLVEAEALAWQWREFDTLARLYLPLQEARRQIRQRCGEGAIQLHLLARSSGELIDPQQIISGFPHGQLLVAGRGTIQPAVEIRRIALQKQLYVETFLAAVYPVIDSDSVIAIVGLEKSSLPPPVPRPIDELQTLLPANSVLLETRQIPADSVTGNATTFAGVMALWERLHTPFLLAAGIETDAIRRMEAYRLTLRVDPACELAHQFLAEIARHLARGVKSVS